MTSVEDLLAKYVEMVRLRELHAEDDEPDPRQHMVALASRFPGALRELDELSMDELHARVAQLVCAAVDSSQVTPWMTAQSRFHALTRGALCAKRWLAGRKRVDARVVEDFDRATGGFAWPDDARAWRDDLERIAAPPRGRVTDVVFERIAIELSITTVDARRLVFGDRQRERRSA